MAKGKKTSEEVKAKITEIKLLDMELSALQIEAMVKGTEWETSHDTINRILEDLRTLALSEEGKKQIQRLDTIIGGIEKITSKLVISLQEKEEHSVNDVKTLNDIAKTNFERKQLLTGKPTDITKHEGLSDEQALLIAERFLGKKKN